MTEKPNPTTEKASPARDLLPPLTLPDQRGHLTPLATLAGPAGLVLITFRGHW